MKEICVIIPTHKRLADLILTANTWANTTEGRSQVVIGVDDNDSTYNNLIKEGRFPFIWERVKPKPWVHILNELAVKYAKEYKYIGFVEDDHRFLTKGWESAFISKLEELGPNGMVWCNDLLNKNKLMGAPFINSNIINKLGLMAPYEFKACTVDVYWTELGKKLGTIHYFPNIIIEHQHFTRGKRAKDVTSIKCGIDSRYEAEYYRSQKYRDDLESHYKKLTE